MNEIKKAALHTIDAHANTFTAISDAIWDELSLKEFKAAALYTDALEKLGFTVQKNLCGIETAFSGSYGSGHPVIGILGEFDALSGLSQQSGVAEAQSVTPGGNGHGCGHNLLGAGSLAAAAAVKEYLAAAPSFSSAAPARRAARPRRIWRARGSGTGSTPRSPGTRPTRTRYPPARTTRASRCSINSTASPRTPPETRTTGAARSTLWSL